MRDALLWAASEGLEVFVLGGGSNVLIADRGFDGLVIRAEMEAETLVWNAERGELQAGAGVDWDRLVRFTVERDLAGLECLSGIPGLAGATPIQNVGAYGQEIASTLASVELMDRATGALSRLPVADCDLRYRDSAFKRHLRGKYVITEVRFTLTPRGAPLVAYPELERHLQTMGKPPYSLAAVRDAVITLRRSKSMVLDPNDENRRSAGSFFTNPIVSEAEAEEAKRRWLSLRRDESAMPAFPAEGRVKLSAAWLIERSGFAKGRTKGEVGISSRHSLALVNRGGATAASLLAFAREVRDGVRTTFGVTLVPEPELIGCEWSP